MLRAKSLDRKFRLARVWSNKELRKLAHLFSDKRIVNVSAGDDNDKEGNTYSQYFRSNKYWLTNYQPGSYRGFKGRKNEILLDLSEPLPMKHRGKFDVAFCHTVLEHIYDVHTAFSNICALSRDIVIVVVPFAQIQHESEDFGDYWRFSPSCLRRMFEHEGLEVVYESANNDFNSAVYVFFVGSKQPLSWRNRMPDWRKVENAASWLGDDAVTWKTIFALILRRCVF